LRREKFFRFEERRGGAFSFLDLFFEGEGGGRRGFKF